MSPAEIKARLELNAMYELARKKWGEHPGVQHTKLKLETNLVAEPNQPKWLAFTFPAVGAHVKLHVDSCYDQDTQTSTRICKLQPNWGRLVNYQPEALVMYSEVTEKNVDLVMEDAVDHIYNFFQRMERLRQAEDGNRRR